MRWRSRKSRASRNACTVIVSSSLHASRSTGACAAAHARLPLLRRTVTSLRAAFAALPSCPA
ncbi:hypothetical protein CFB48_29285 [Burkholderia sp. AU33647]|nr:hypothetical protein CFB48_29285 [Burkholderia sp. AU33647]